MVRFMNGCPRRVYLLWSFRLHSHNSRTRIGKLRKESVDKMSHGRDGNGSVNKLDLKKGFLARRDNYLMFSRSTETSHALMQSTVHRVFSTSSSDGSAGSSAA